MLFTPGSTRQRLPDQDKPGHNASDRGEQAFASKNPWGEKQPQAEDQVDEAQRPCDFRHGDHGDGDDERARQVIAVGMGPVVPSVSGLNINQTPTTHEATRGHGSVTPRAAETAAGPNPSPKPA